MVLREEILKEHSKEHALSIANYACQSRTNFKELMTCFLDDEYRLAQRAAWGVCFAAKKKPEMIYPHVKDLVSVLHKKNVHDAVIRNAVRVLQEIEIPEKYHGEIMDACFQFLQKPMIPVAIKAFSLTTLFKLSEIYPEIKPELKLIINDRLDYETAAFRSRAKKILPKL
ncbi:MAG TPA: hypothetical protein VNT20_14090 [Flavisolibacter sp.]|nr:hypothetical protein [Flavisolibacter sp.]